MTVREYFEAYEKAASLAEEGIPLGQDAKNRIAAKLRGCEDKMGLTKEEEDFARAISRATTAN